MDQRDAKVARGSAISIETPTLPPSDLIAAVATSRRTSATSWTTTRLRPATSLLPRYWADRSLRAGEAARHARRASEAVEKRIDYGPSRSLRNSESQLAPAYRLMMRNTGGCGCRRDYPTDREYGIAAPTRRQVSEINRKELIGAGHLSLYLSGLFEHSRRSAVHVNREPFEIGKERIRG